MVSRRVKVSLVAFAGMGFFFPFPVTASAITPNDYWSNCNKSTAWKNATPGEKSRAKKGWIKQYGSFNNASKADLKHSYMGTRHNHPYVIADIPVIIVPIKGADPMFVKEVSDACIK